ncbi:MAG TPA: M48 family peptidase [Desulfobacteraceae bacterium]|nr:M48 family peptidase [Desulfobacteraceae bacterium]
MLFISCAEVPLTQRKSLHILPQSQMLALSLQQYDDVLKKSKICTDPEKVVMVKRTGERISAAAESFLEDSGLEEQIKYFKWEFNLIEDDNTVNAWCMPGGKIAVYTGILPFTKDENGLAVVLGHEVAHAIANHGNERMSQALLVSMGGVALSVALQEKPDRTKNLFMAAFGMGASVGFLLPYSRLHEYEADRIGLSIMSRAGYDPREAITFWERMRQKGGGKHPPEFLSTHPAPDSRIADLKVHVAEALPYYERYRKQ